MHYHYTLHISEDEYKQLMELCKILNNPKFEAIDIKISPNNLIPEELQEFTGNFIKRIILSISGFNKKIH